VSQISLQELEHALVLAVIGDIKPREASDRMLESLTKLLGGPCEIVVGHVAATSSASDQIAFQFGSLDDPSATTVLLSGDGAKDVPAEDRDRIKKMFLALHELAYPIPRGAKSVHQLRNRLTGVLTNIELIEMYVDQEGGLDAEQIQELQVSVRHALASCREMADIVRNLGGFVDASRVKKLAT
jgi:hypothetical protein